MIKHVFIVQHGDIIETVYRGATHYNGQIVHLTDAGAVDAIYESRAAARIAAITACMAIEAEYHTKALEHAAEMDLFPVERVVEEGALQELSGGDRQK